VGPQWIASSPKLTTNGSGYQLASSALVSLGNGDYSDGTQGAVYCKLWTPGQMLYWLLVRAFETDPLASEPKPPVVEPGTCNPGAPLTGSCVFLFAPANTHYCEEYTGATWTSASAEAKCTSRAGVYSPAPCVARSAETGGLDGDGVYKGKCVLKCGAPDEYIWNNYSGAGDGSSCPTGKWFPATP
jgi:hypothetical protein